MRRINRRIWPNFLGVGVAVGLTLAAFPAFAEGTILDKAVNDLTRGWQLSGPTASQELIKDPTVSGGIAERVTVTQAGVNPWDAGGMNTNAKKISQGDVLLLAFWAKAVEPPAGDDSVTIFARIQESNPPYNAVGMQETLSIGKTWKMYYAKGAAPKDYRPGNISGAINIATGKQVIDFGPILLLDFGPNYDINKLPHN